MTLSNAVAYAIEHSSAVATQRAAVTQAGHTLALQLGTAYPEISAGVSSLLTKSANYQGQFAVIGQSQQNVVSQNTAQLGITNWNITTGGFSFLAVAAARAQLNQAENALASTEDNIASSVTSGFLGIAQKRAIVAVDQDTLDAQMLLARVARAKEHIGVVAGVDVLQAQTSAAKSQSSLVADRTAVADATESLAQQIGAPLQTKFAIPADVRQPALPPQPLDTLISIADANRPDIEGARQALAASRYTRRGWNVELFPQVQVSATIGNQFSPTSAVQEQNSQEQYCQVYKVVPCPAVPRGIPGFWSIQAVSTFALPLVDYNARHSERVNDDAQNSAAETNLVQTRLEAELDVRESYRAAESALAQLHWAGQEVQTGSESARIAQIQYKAGVKTVYDVLQAQQAAEQGQTDLINAKIAYINAVVRLRVALGTFTPLSAVADLE